MRIIIDLLSKAILRIKWDNVWNTLSRALSKWLLLLLKVQVHLETGQSHRAFPFRFLLRPVWQGPIIYEGFSFIALPGSPDSKSGSLSKSEELVVYARNPQTQISDTANRWKAKALCLVHLDLYHSCFNIWQVEYIIFFLDFY